MKKVIEWENAKRMDFLNLLRKALLPAIVNQKLYFGREENDEEDFDNSN